MRPRRTWPLWLLGLTLKVVGATWDVSWHFKLRFDQWSPAHLTSAIGFVLIAVAFLIDWHRRSTEDQAALNIVGIGFGVFLLAVPLDQLWHIVFGIDLTTWSPTHLMLFTGTALTVSGLCILALVDAGWNGQRTILELRVSTRTWALLGLLGVFLVDAVVFPATFQEHSAVAWWNHQHANVLYTPDPGIEQLTVTVGDALHGGLPVPLYPAFMLAAGMFLVLLMRRVTGLPGFASFVMGVFAIQRAVGNVPLQAFGWPPSVTPWHLVTVAVAIEAVLWTRPTSLARSAVAAVAATATATLTWIALARAPPALPVDLPAIPWAVAGALLGWILAEAALRTPTRIVRVATIDPMQYVRHWAARFHVTAGVWRR